MAGDWGHSYDHLYQCRLRLSSVEEIAVTRAVAKHSRPAVVYSWGRDDLTGPAAI